MTTARKSQIWWTILLIITIFSPSLPAYAKYSGGTGEPNDPYQIYTAEQMNAIGANQGDWDKHFKLMANIDLSTYKGFDFNVIGDLYAPFTGLFDGNYKKISNFSCNAGLFGYVGRWGEIKDLGLIDPNVDDGTGYLVGSLVGNNGGTITNCYVEKGSVSGKDYVGGLVGVNYSWGTVTNCYAMSSVSGDWCVGGLVGENWGTIINCYSSSGISGGSGVGGLVGQNGDIRNAGAISYCYSIGSVSCDNKSGGLVGLNVSGSVMFSFWDIQTSGQTTSAGGTGKTTDEMQMASTFIGWGGCGNEGIWTIDDGNDYPRLSWENKPGEAFETQQLSHFLTGAGTETEPYLISTPEQFNTIGLFPCEWDKHFKLIADIDLSSYKGTDFNIIGYWVDEDTADYKSFTGVFDGNGKKISNFTYTDTSSQDNTNPDRRREVSSQNRGSYATQSVKSRCCTDYIGLFGYVDDPNAEIKNLGLINPNVDIETGDNIGSLVGELFEGKVTYCYSRDGRISGYIDVGGLLGGNWEGTISNCYSTNIVSGEFSCGGLVGGILEGTISNCYSTGSVSCRINAGGLLGFNNKAEVISSLWDTETSGLPNMCGNPGNDATAAGCNDSYGKTTVEMQTDSTFLEAGWDFVDEEENGTKDIWWIDEGQDYPRLWWERLVWFADYAPLDPNEYGIKTFEWVYGQAGEYTRRIGESETIPYLSGPITGVQIIEDNNTLVGTNDGYNVSFLASGEWVLSTDPNLTAHPTVWSFAGLYDGMIIDQGVWYLVKKDMSEWKAVDSQQLLIDIQDITVPQANHNNAVIFWYLDTDYSFTPLDFHGKESDLGITLPSSSQAAGFSVTGFDIYAVNTGLIAHGDIDAATGSMNDLTVLKKDD